jgi:hypothetical protein
MVGCLTSFASEVKNAHHASVHLRMSYHLLYNSNLSISMVQAEIVLFAVNRN